MKKMKGLIATILLALAIVFVVNVPSLKAAESVDDGIWQYTYVKGTYVVSGYIGKAKDVIIPTSYEGKQISEVSVEAFKDNQTIESVVIPKQIVTVGKGAFMNCSHLSKVVIQGDIADCQYFEYYGAANTVFRNAGNASGGFDVEFTEGVTTIPDNIFSSASSKGDGYYARIKSVKIASTVTTIGSRAFMNCYDLKSVDFGDGVKNIEEYAFVNATGLETLNFGKNVYEIGKGAFEGCTELEKIDFANVVLIDENAFYEDTSIKTLNIGESVTTISTRAFATCTGIEKITLPAKVSALGTGAFKDCTALKSLDIYGDIGECQYFEYYGPTDTVFRNAGAASGGFDVEFKEGVKDVPANIFSSASAKGDVYYARIKSVKMAPTVEKIGSRAFMNCYDLKSVDFGSGVKEIKEYAFVNDSGLTSLVFGDSVYEIGKCAFMSCTALKDIDFKNVVLIDESAFNGDTSIAKLNIGTSVTTIGEYAFYGCTDITDIVLPKSVSSLGKGAFKEVTGLKKLTISGDIGECQYHEHYGATDTVFRNAGAASGGFDVEFTDGVTSVPANIFSSHSVKADNYYVRVKTVSLPLSVKEIGDYAFYHCYALTSVTGGYGVKNCGENAFADCTLSIVDCHEDSGLHKCAVAGNATTINVQPHAIVANHKAATTKADGYDEQRCTLCDTALVSSTIRQIGNIDIKYTEKVYSGKALKPSVIVKNVDGEIIPASNYIVTYSNNKKVGKATVTIKFKKNYAGTVKKTFKIIPKGTSIKKIKGGKGNLVVTWKKQPKEISGYEISYSTSSYFSYAKTYKVKSASKTSAKIGKLGHGNYYYLRIRTYKTVNGKNYYSAWKTCSNYVYVR